MNNARANYKFRFGGLLTQQAKQEEVFERVARGVVTSALDGINGCVFAYGQTGSGKTFTITGGPERYVDRGMIPRTISFIFSELAQRSDYSYTLHISYLEIYQDSGYDLLDSANEKTSMEDLPKVSLMEDEDGRFHLRSLSAHRVATEEDALNLLFLGDTNRMISETPMNMASSRSHCIFSVAIEARKAGEETVRRSKLHLVDLAGSERVGRTGVDGQTLAEAKYINSSLHFLEQVIVALQAKSQGKKRLHVPYRNSMMTSVLRDSLGGNCRTAMIATVSAQDENIHESISTCRFAARVACIRNEVVVNEELDPKLVITRLKLEIRELKEEIKMLNGGEEERGPLTADEVDQLRQAITKWCKGEIDSLPLGGAMIKIRGALDLFKDMVKKGGVPGAQSNSSAGGGSGEDAAVNSEVVRKLRLQVLQRDNEINILVSMLKKYESGHTGGPVPISAAPTAGLAVKSGYSGGGKAVGANAAAGSGQASPARSTTGSGGGRAAAPAAAPHGASADENGGDLGNIDLLADRSKAFEVFRKSYRRNQAIDENKAVLRTKYAEAKKLGEAVNGTRARINAAKSSIEAMRRQAAAQAAAAGGEAPAEMSPQEQTAREEIEHEKAAYKEKYQRLRELKAEIDHLHKLLEQSRLKMQTDFESWMRAMTRQRTGHAAEGRIKAGSRPSSAAQRPAQRQLAYEPGGAALDSGAAPAGRGAHDPGPPRQAWGAEPVSSGGERADAPRSPARAIKTGNAQADADIEAFYAARDKLLKARTAR